MHLSTYGYQLPDQSDPSKGTTGWMAQYSFNIARFDLHSHNGQDSAILTAAAFSGLSVTAAAGSWIASTGGTNLPATGYQQAVTVPTGVSEINNYSITFRVSSADSRNNQPLTLFYNRLTATTFTLYCNDNSVSVVCLFR